MVVSSRCRLIRRIHSTFAMCTVYAYVLMHLRSLVCLSIFKHYMRHLELDNLSDTQIDTLQFILHLL